MRLCEYHVDGSASLTRVFGIYEHYVDGSVSLTRVLGIPVFLRVGPSWWCLGFCRVGRV